jgi:hypothetical protein
VSRRHHIAPQATAAALLLAIAAPAICGAAAIPTCLTVDASDPRVRPGFEKLVRVELARHPSHALVETGCDAALVVQLFDVAGSRQLTMRLGDEVPVRYTIGKDDPLPARVSEAMSLVLGNDPQLLSEDVTKLSAMERAKNNVLVRGANTWRFELFEAAYRTGEGASFASGGAFGASRGAEHWQVTLRAYFLGRLGEPEGDAPALKLAAGADAGIAYELSALSNATLYVAVGLGLQYVRFEGRVASLGGDIDEVDAFAPHGFGRLGVRMLRTCDFDLDLFVAGYLPMMTSKETDRALFADGRWTPSAQMGIGVGF